MGNFLGVGLDVMRYQSVPATIGIGLAVNVLVPEHELGEQRTIVVEILDPEMLVSDGAEFPMKLDDYEHRPEGRQPSTMTVISLRFEADQYGQYTINLRLGDRITSVPIFVLAPPQ